MDPYEFLPGYGENDVFVSTIRFELRVRIEYDGPDNLLAHRTMIFEKPAGFLMASYPGVSLFNGDYGDFARPKIGALIEYPDSELAEAWRSHFGPRSRDIKHFEMLFLSANKSLVVFASRFHLEAVS